MNPRAGTMLHPAAELRNDLNTPPNLAAGRRELPCSLATGVALGPSTTWVSPSNRHFSILTIGSPPSKVSCAR